MVAILEAQLHKIVPAMNTIEFETALDQLLDMMKQEGLPSPYVAFCAAEDADGIKDSALFSTWLPTQIPGVHPPETILSGKRIHAWAYFGVLTQKDDMVWIFTSPELYSGFIAMGTVRDA